MSARIRNIVAARHAKIAYHMRCGARDVPPQCPAAVPQTLGRGFILLCLFAALLKTGVFVRAHNEALIYTLVIKIAHQPCVLCMVGCDHALCA